MTITAGTYNHNSEATNSQRPSFNKQSSADRLHQSNSDLRKKTSLTHNVKHSYIVQRNNYTGRESATNLAQNKSS